MKRSFFSRLFRKRARKKSPEKPVATPEDVQRKLASYQRVEGPSSFNPAAVYFVNEVDSDKSTNPRTARAEGKKMELEDQDS